MKFIDSENVFVKCSDVWMVVLRLIVLYFVVCYWLLALMLVCKFYDG